MLVIREQQLEQMEEARERQYARELSRYFRVNLPQLALLMAESELEHHVGVAVKYAQKLGIQKKDGFTQYVALALVSGPGFHNSPAMRKFMSQPGAAPEVKIERLVALMSSKLQRKTQ